MELASSLVPVIAVSSGRGRIEYGEPLSIGTALLLSKVELVP